MTEYCILHKKIHSSSGWKNKGNGWYCCDNLTYPEFVPEYIKEDRKKNLKSQVQSHRQGTMSKEFIENYPEKVKGMLKEGAVTEKEVKNARYVWKDLPGYSNLNKTQ